jgi:hypothetical protein
VATAEDVMLKIRRDIDHERVSSFIHHGNDIAFGDHLRRLKQRPHKRMRDSTREFGAIFVDNGERAVMQLLRIAPRLNHYGEREGIDDEPQQHVVMQEASQLLDAEPVDVRNLAQRYRSCLRSKRTFIRVKTGTKTAKAARLGVRVRKPNPLVKVPTLIGTK